MILIILAVIWGSSFILIKRSLEASDGSAVFSPIQLACGRMFFAGIVLLPIFLKTIHKLKRAQLGFLFLVGLFGNAIPAFLFAKAETEISSALAGMLNSTTPFFTIIIASSFFRKKSSWQKWAGIILGLAGSVGLVLAGNGSQIEFNLYAGMVLLGTLCYGLSVNIIHEKLSGVGSLEITSVALMFVGIPMGMYLGFTNFADIVKEHPHGIWSFGYLLILAVIGTALALIYFNKLIKMTDGIFASTVTYLIPIVAIIWGLAIKEFISPKQLIFMGVILIGVFITNRQYR
ncbi:MAG: DMT family transporter [Flavobacteriales bacterium]|nr:DMT family transporter [Flavobacteriales bacterium]